jgi:hypothetical protein
MRNPDVVIGDPQDPYLRRWWVIPRNRVFNIYLHHFLRSDDDRALHDHPWLFNCSILVKGAYDEVTFSGTRRRRQWLPYFRWGKAPHRVELVSREVWTVFITGPVVRDWGFYCPQGWRHWREFTDPGNEGATGRGCE